MKIFQKVQNSLNKFSKVASSKIQPLYAKAKNFANDVARKVERTAGQVGNALNSDTARSLAAAASSQFGPEAEILRRQAANTLKAIGNRASGARDQIQRLPSNVPNIQFTTH